MTIIQKIRHKLIPDWLRKAYYSHLRKKEYEKMRHMPESEYEDYLCTRYSEMMNRVPHTRGKTMDFKNPVTYTQKQQWMKLYDQSKERSQYSDKYAVREHIKATIGEEYLIPLISINGKDHFDDPKEIDFDRLPNAFVIKCNHGSHYNVIVKDKSKLTPKDIKKIKKQLAVWLREHYAFLVGMELVYEQIKPTMIIEEYMAIDDDLPDYKFMCFSGEVKYVWCDQGRFADHRRSVFDLDYNLMSFNLHIHENVKDMRKPENFEKMVELAAVLCEDFPYVRVDLYNVKGRIYFGEMTFCSGAGYQSPNPVEYDKVLGDMIQLDLSVRDNNYRYRKRKG
jgi:hypothetical protein